MFSATEQLRREIAREVYDQLMPAAHAGWQRYLLTRLSWAGVKALHRKFEIFKTVRAAFLPPSSKQGIVRDQFYRQFVRRHGDEQLRSLLKEFPLLARWCATLVENWRAAVAEFLARLQADRAGLSDHFRSKRFAGRVAAIEAGLSDPHAGGRCVVRVVFEDAATLIYKPRSVAPEALFARLLEDLSRADDAPPLLGAQCWNRGEHGWMEDIVATPCVTTEDVRRFYWRAGVLVGLAYYARGVDFHQGNLVAAGPFPVLIDLETLWHPQDHVHLASPTATSESVLRTGFLPHRNPLTGRFYPWSILGPISSQSASAPGWVYVNQDQMAWGAHRSHPREHSHHLPTIQNPAIKAGDFVDEIKAGYRWAGRQLYERSPARIRRWLRALVGSPRRRLLRTTAEYQVILEQLTSPQFLRCEHGASEIRRRLLESNPSLDSDELNALAQLDIPYLLQPRHPHDGGFEDLGDDVLTEETYLAQIPIIKHSLAPQI